jgi:predicted transcriptional regulator
VGRSRTEILGQMLEIANNFTTEDYRTKRNAISKLKRMYKGFLPYAQLVEYVTFLLENELLAYREYERRYRITQKGLRFLRLYRELRQMISSKQEDRIQEQDTFNGYRWPYQVTAFTTTSSGPDERHSPYSFI